MHMIETLGIILLIVTSHGQMENGKPTGLWLEEFAVPYEIFVDAGYQVIVASPKGGPAPIDPRSLPVSPTEAEAQAIERLKETHPLAHLTELRPDAVFFAGGHGTMFDFPSDGHVKAIVTRSLLEEVPLGLVCHGPAALTGAVDADGRSLIRGKKLTGFTNSEEAAVNLTDSVPFLLETRLKEMGGRFSSVDNFQPHVVVDGHLVTGQNPASSKASAEALLRCFGSP